MHADKHPRRDRRPAVRSALLAPAILAIALVATAAVVLTVGLSVTPKAKASVAALGVSGQPATTTAHGWRVVTKTGPAAGGVSGRLSAGSAGDAWSVWTGAGFTSVERWTRSVWRPVPVPARLADYVRSAVAFGASSASDFWLLDSHRTTTALRWTGSKWTLAAIPSWVLRPTRSGALHAAVSVFGPDNVWVFSFGRGGYAAHYDGHAWTKVTLPVVPAEESTTGPDDIYVAGNGEVFRWNGSKWTDLDLPVIPLPSGASARYSHLTAAGPSGGWLLREISYAGEQTTYSTLLHWTGTGWTSVAGPADIVGSIAPDGAAGLWADGIDINPGGFWLLYHYSGGKWSDAITPPSGVDTHAPTPLTSIPGTRSLWATGTSLTFTPKGYDVILKYGV